MPVQNKLANLLKAPSTSKHYVYKHQIAEKILSCSVHYTLSLSLSIFINLSYTDSLSLSLSLSLFDSLCIYLSVYIYIYIYIFVFWSTDGNFRRIQIYSCRDQHL